MPDIRDRRRRETRRALQEHALRLFTERGYDSTTVNDVAEAAGVSAMTVYRHFPSKEDLVLLASYDELIAERVAAQPPDQPDARRIGRAIVDTATAGVASDADRRSLLALLRLMIDTPAIRARHLDSQYATQTAIVEAMRTEATDPETEFRRWVTAGACLAAMHAAVVRWADEDGRPELPGLIETALSATFANEFP
ncbi:TetR/AcrR family transcriptional regulator [Stackebrandtia nassauensis]|uniref:Transcriptional regulator, TetR family n=1 Tax=Stackebrandtia nassauensis (strain DSM 44728 / CIP 108903 / NRRL B-16338 / NBRC 102104 / LLR-40K-21) TaxID=446470 RepID=D3Q8I4_STANL|nr:TetR/AcrR family transcriptional regulator [Stackebrandtia nassauensis]ADD42558.1 transcriptional regulator, TetR family [Stackebrandtia nassauensis DSM 44728]